MDNFYTCPKLHGPCAIGHHVLEPNKPRMRPRKATTMTPHSHRSSDAIQDEVADAISVSMRFLSSSHTCDPEMHPWHTQGSAGLEPASRLPSRRLLLIAL
mmetsp:Transcript_5265/g.19291  ORF Transcript_5265/g.19291 Transcript_5265/m.19291 type:complete len:100 (+) Transcript_5265:1257-1556(+)